MFLVNNVLKTIQFGSKWEYGWNVIGHVVNCWAGWWVHKGSLYFSLQFWIYLREFPQSNIKYNLTAWSAVGILQDGANHLSPLIAAWTQALWIKLCFFLLCFWRAYLPPLSRASILVQVLCKSGLHIHWFRFLSWLFSIASDTGVHSLLETLSLESCNKSFPSRSLHRLLFPRLPPQASLTISNGP